jgi:hypothetical protein
MILTRDSRCTLKEACPMPLCPPQIPYGFGERMAANKRLGRFEARNREREREIRKGGCSERQYIYYYYRGNRKVSCCEDNQVVPARPSAKGRK